MPPTPKKPKKDGPTMKDWYAACEMYVKLQKIDPKLKKTAFLASDASGDKITNNKTHQNRFIDLVKKFKNNELEPTNCSRQRKRKFASIEKKLIEYLDERSDPSWKRIRAKCFEWAEEDGIKDFKCTDGWMTATLKRHGKTLVKNQEEGGREVKDLSEINAEPEMEVDPSNLVVLDRGEGKNPRQTEIKVEYAFTKENVLAESYRSPWNTLRLGRLMEDLDALAASIALDHVGQVEEEDDDDDKDGEKEKEPKELELKELEPLIVTASVDSFRLRKECPPMPCDQILSGRLTYVGTSSMEIRMRCTTKKDTEPWLEAFTTFVAVDPETNKPVPIIPLNPQSLVEKTRYDEGAQRSVLRRKKRRGKNKQIDFSKIHEVAEALLAQGCPSVLNVPIGLGSSDVQHDNSTQMSSTVMQNTVIVEPTVRSKRDRICGGFLMRRAFELAFANALAFAGAQPKFRAVDEFSFEAPAKIGNVLVLHSRVLYTSSNCRSRGGGDDDNDDDTTITETDDDLPLVHLEVEAFVTKPEEGDAKLSTRFNFTFAITGSDETNHTENDDGSKDDDEPKVRRILPANMGEATRMAMQMAANRHKAYV